MSSCQNLPAHTLCGVDSGEVTDQFLIFLLYVSYKPVSWSPTALHCSVFPAPNTPDPTNHGNKAY